MILSTRHTGLVVRNLNESLLFYKNILGLSILSHKFESGSYIDNVVGIKDVKLEWIKLQAPDGSLVELIQYHSHPDNSIREKSSPSNKIGCSHIAFTVSNIDILYTILCEKGYHCSCFPQISSDGFVKVLYCHDPDGIIIELVEELNNESK